MERPRARNAERMVGLIAVGTLVAAWMVGMVRGEADVSPALRKAVPEAGRLEPLGRGTWAAWASRSPAALVGYVKIASARGYGGPLSVAVAADPQGKVIGVAIVDHKETPSYFRRVVESDLLGSLEGKTYEDEFALGRDLDAVSGATLSTRAIAAAAGRGVRDVAATRLGLAVPEETGPRIVFGAPEMFLIALYVVGFIGRLQATRFTKIVRWSSLVAGLLLLGFVYSKPLTLSMVNQLLLGFWPQWQTDLYWYLLIGGIVIFFAVERKNAYCNWFCPFGAAQECLGALGKAKARSPGRYRGLLKWLQRCLAWAAIVVALLYRNPGASSYEVSGVLFGLVGSTAQLVLLGLVLVASLFVLRPWCTYLCPIRPVEDFFRMTGRWVKGSWRKTGPGPAA